MIWKVRGVQAHRTVARSPRVRRGPLIVHSQVSGAARPRVSYAIPVAVGDAVTRNRVRRRLRAAVQANGARLHTGHDYLIRATQGAASATYSELSTKLGEALEAIDRGRE